MCAVVVSQEIEGLQEKLQTEVQQTFAEVLSLVAKDPAKNSGADAQSLYQLLLLLQVFLTCVLVLKKLMTHALHVFVIAC